MAESISSIAFIFLGGGGPGGGGMGGPTPMGSKHDVARSRSRSQKPRTSQNYRPAAGPVSSTESPLMLRFSPLLVVLIAAESQGQSLQNPDFETLIDCPAVFGPDISIQVTMANWLTVQDTPDGLYDTCATLEPSGAFLPGLPLVAYGHGYGGIWGPGEVMGQSLDVPVQPNLTYCLEFSAIAVDLASTGVAAGDPCLRLCVYGSTVAPVMPDPWDIPIPIEDMTGTTLLACSDPVSLSAWSDHLVNFVPDVVYPHLFFTSSQDSGCVHELPYFCLDNMILTSCDINAVAEVDEGSGFLQPGPVPGSFHITTDADVITGEVFDMTGRRVARVRSHDTMIDLRSRPEGIYIVRLLTAHGWIVQRVFKR